MLEPENFISDFQFDENQHDQKEQDQQQQVDEQEMEEQVIHQTKTPFKKLYTFNEQNDPGSVNSQNKITPTMQNQKTPQSTKQNVPKRQQTPELVVTKKNQIPPRPTLQQYQQKQVPIQQQGILHKKIQKQPAKPLFGRNGGGGGGSAKLNGNSRIQMQKQQRPPVSQFKQQQQLSQQKNQVRGQQENSSYDRLISVSVPVLYCQDENALKISNRKYEVAVEYLDNLGKKRSKKVRFGSYQQSDYIDHENEGKRTKLLSQIKKCENPTQPNFWRKHLLNGENNDIYQNYCDFVMNEIPTIIQ